MAVLGVSDSSWGDGRLGMDLGLAGWRFPLFDLPPKKGSPLQEGLGRSAQREPTSEGASKCRAALGRRVFLYMTKKKIFDKIIICVFTFKIAPRRVLEI